MSPFGKPQCVAVGAAIMLALCAWSQPTAEEPPSEATTQTGSPRQEPPPKYQKESPLPDRSSNDTSGDKSKPRVADFAEGVRIDWSAPAVELESMVVLREGPLELFACRPGIREHESILAVRAKSIDIYNAIGLIGVKPGHPVRYDLEKQKVIPPTGEQLSIDIRYKDDPIENDAIEKDAIEKDAIEKVEKTVPLEFWMRDVKTGKQPDPQKWIFTGSIKIEDDAKLAAEYEGTIICVVDFDTALIGPADIHSADNEALWIEAFTDRIPPRGTRCSILIKPAAPNSAGAPTEQPRPVENTGEVTKEHPRVEPEATPNHNAQHD